MCSNLMMFTMEQNTKGNKRGQGRIKKTEKTKEKRPRNWIPKDRESFIEDKKSDDLGLLIHFDTMNLNKKSFIKNKGTL